MPASPFERAAAARPLQSLGAPSPYQAVVSISPSALTRAAYRPANAWATHPPIEHPATAAAAQPTWSSNSARSRANCSTVKDSARRSDFPCPRQSYVRISTRPANFDATPFQMLPSSAKEWMSASRCAPGCRAGRSVYAMAQLSEVVKVFFGESFSIDLFLG